MIGGMRFGQRIKGVLMLDAITFEEIEADRTANGQALLVVLLWSLAAGIGGAGTGSGLVIEAVGALVGWVSWAGLTLLLGAKLWPEPQTRSDMGELLRVIGFSSAPGLFAVLAAIPLLGGVIMVAVNLWMMASMVVGVRQALDYRSTLRAFAVVFVGWLVFLLIVQLVQPSA
jgi:hypothetical protein